ncbi:MAG: hypothetical protein NUW01_12740 [Gemmatimonadaceae bacterium]|nr:hypothetical protein [Gemmatimonadaceae bacterium]
MSDRLRDEVELSRPAEQEWWTHWATGELIAEIQELREERDVLLGAHEASVKSALLNERALELLAASETQVEWLGGKSPYINRWWILDDPDGSKREAALKEANDLASTIGWVYAALCAWANKNGDVQVGRQRSVFTLRRISSGEIIGSVQVSGADDPKNIVVKANADRWWCRQCGEWITRPAESVACPQCDGAPSEVQATCEVCGGYGRLGVAP